MTLINVKGNLTNTSYNPIDIFLRRQKSINTQRAYRKDLEDFFKFLLKYKLRPDQVTPAIADAYIQEVEKTCKATTLNRKIGTLKSFYKWFSANDYIAKNPFSVVKIRPINDRTPTNSLSDEEAIRLLQAADVSTLRGNCDRMVMVLMFCCALRLEETLSLKLSDIQFRNGFPVLSVVRKGGEREDVALTDQVYREIHAYLDRFQRLSGRTIQHDENLIQRTKKNTGRPVGSTTIYTNIEILAVKCGITTKVTPHVCRTTAINQLVEVESNPFRVAKAVGHKSVKTTMGYYRNRDAVVNSPLRKLDFKLNTNADTDETA